MAGAATGPGALSKACRGLTPYKGLCRGDVAPQHSQNGLRPPLPNSETALVHMRLQQNDRPHRLLQRASGLAPNPDRCHTLAQQMQQSYHLEGQGMFDLTGKCALITGASGGIGGEIAKALHAAGATVGLSGTREAPLQALADELGERAFVLPCNLSDPEAVTALPKQAADAMGSVDILVNNAGITRDNLFMRMSDDEWQSVIDVNLTATYKLCKGVLRGMMKARWGRIINISSIVGATGNPGQGNYAAAKAGLVGMTKSLAYEVASRGITANAVAPGFIETAMTDKLNDEQKSGIMGQIPAGRMGTADEIAAAVLYLSSPEAGYVTGATLHVNGGMAML